MEAKEYARIARVEDDHWWYQNTRAMASDLLAPWLGSGQRILDAGCGPGGNSAWLARHGQVVALDLNPDGLEFVRARRPSLTPVRGNVTALPFPDRTFDVVVALTVVYSVSDDDAAVREFGRVLRSGGALLVMEPAFRSLRRAHDKTVHSRHRYRRAELTARIRGAGLDVRRATYAYSFLVGPAAVLSMLDRLAPGSLAHAGSDVDRRGLDRVFARLARLERRHLQHADVPIGTSALVLATRSDSGR